MYKKINVTRTFLPPLAEYTEQVKRAFDNEWLTNRGELVLELEAKLMKYLDVDNILITNNGTVPLQIALKLLANGGEVITTPFSYVATTAAIVWENCTPVFVDIHPDYLTIDVSKIEAAITPRTTCILATHVFGNPCDIEAIDILAKKYQLKVIYDAAHCFGVKYKGKSIFSYGDVSTCSFHATKLFHTGEGGAVFCKDLEMRQKIYYSHNFGHKSTVEFHGLGINAKISELQAAMGLAVLPYINYIFDERKLITDYFSEGIIDTSIKSMVLMPNVSWNYSYFPVVFNSEVELLRVLNALEINGIYARRYFYPSLNTINYTYGKSCPISEDVSSRVLCLPLYAGLEMNDTKRILEIVKNCLD